MFLGLSFTWPWNPGTLLFLIILCLLYAFGIWQTRKNNTQARPIKAYQIIAFIVAIAIMALIVLTPIDTIARTQLFAAHMVQVIVLTTLCSPLLLLACPAWLLQPLLNLPIIRSIAQVITKPVAASIIFNGTFLILHAPGLYHAMLQYGTFYHLQLFIILLASLVNWWPLLGSVREFRRVSYPAQMLYAFFDGIPLDIFAFLLVYTGVVFYPYYTVPSQLVQVGYTALTDQLVAGALLLLPGLVDLVVMTPLFFFWLGQMERQAKINDQRLQELAEAEMEQQEESEAEEAEASET